MKTQILLENDIRHADRRHPVDILEPLPTPEDQLQRICEVLSRTFGWVAEADTVEQKGLRASVVLYCVRADLLGSAIPPSAVSSESRGDGGRWGKPRWHPDTFRLRVFRSQPERAPRWRGDAVERRRD